MVYMFRTILVHHQEQLYKLYITFGIRRYDTSGCCVAIATKQPDVPAYTKCDVQLINYVYSEGRREQQRAKFCIFQPPSSSDIGA